MFSKMSLTHLPRIRLAHLPTALEPMERLARAVGAQPRLFVKRDDCTGLALGGNKARKLEFIMADVLEKKADVVVTCGGTQSNHVRLTAAAAALLGLEFHCVLANPFNGTGIPVSEAYAFTGNCLLDGLLGSHIYYVEDDGPATEGQLASIDLKLREAGRTPYFVPLGSSNGIGAMGYAGAAQELLLQFTAQGIDPSHIIVGTGSGGMHAGLLAGLRAVGSDIGVVGFSVSEAAEVKRSKVRNIVEEMLPYWADAPPRVPDKDIVVIDRYVGDGYAVPSRACIEAIRLAASTQGLLLDPVYTGKVMAGFLALLRGGEFRSARDIVFLHSGGAPAIFAYPEQFVPKRAN